MKLIISFQHMDHSDALESHVNERFDKITELLKSFEEHPPLRADVFLKANKQHPHHAVEIHLKTAFFTLDAHDEGQDMYAVVDKAVNRMIALIKKEKDKIKNKNQRPETEKSKFYKS